MKDLRPVNQLRRELLLQRGADVSPIGRVPGVGQPHRDEDQPLAAPEGEAPQGARQPDDASGVQPALYPVTPERAAVYVGMYAAERYGEFFPMNEIEEA